MREEEEVKGREVMEDGRKKMEGDRDHEKEGESGREQEGGTQK